MLSNAFLKKTTINNAQLQLRQFRHLFAQSTQPMLHYVVTENRWSTHYTGYYLTSWLNKLGMQANLCHKPLRMKGDIFHFGDWEVLTKNINASRNDFNWLSATFLYREHQVPFDEAIEQTATYVMDLNKLVVPSEHMMQSFVDHGVKADKLICIPLGVDLNTFFQASSEEKESLRLKFEIPINAFCLGSFQKDGVGWEEGNEPLMQKGPDVFLEVVEQLKKSVPSLFIFLTGPSRGYVKSGLEKLDIPYRHILIDEYHEMRDCYACLDAYLVTSRQECGPSSILEAMTCGVPVISTSVGMASELIEHDYNGLLNDIEDTDKLAYHIEQVANDAEIADKLIINGLEVSRQYCWSEVAALYFEHVYAPLMVQRYS